MLLIRLGMPSFGFHCNLFCALFKTIGFLCVLEYILETNDDIEHNQQINQLQNEMK